ncbi:MAG: beta-galactosidase [Patescibacteria group bacterium]
MIKILKFAFQILLYLLVLILVIYVFLWIWNFFIDELPQDQMVYGVTFSKPYAVELGLDWKEIYLAILDDLKVKNIRLIAYWPEVEPKEGKFDFRDLDFQINEAVKRNAKIILAVGRRLPRWPECHEPSWTLNQNLEVKNEKLLEYIEKTILRYKEVEAIKYWQVENEPFLMRFGICPKTNIEFLDKEIALVHSLDSRPVIISDNGEVSIWINARKRADVFGTTMYRVIWKKPFGYFRYPLPSTFFRFKDFVSKIFTGELFGQPKKVIVIELQAEPWGPEVTTRLTLEEQFVSMDFEGFKGNIGYARRAGFKEVYLWGVEWWYWLKEKANEPRFWEFAKSKIF